MGTIEDTILDAIDIITKSKIDNANYDKTIMAQIISCSDEGTGEYKCSYQGATIIAHSSHPSLKYNVNDNVYILIVADDYAGDGKIIIGKRY